MISALATPEKSLADPEIAAAIERLLSLKKGVFSHQMTVACEEGIVELTGFADNLLSRQRAEDLAKAVRGVRGVINEISIRTADVPDAELRRGAARALAQDPAASSYNVHCQAHDGHLTVEGAVQSWAEQSLVLQVLSGVPGVRILTSELTVRGGALINSDEEITAQICEFLAWDIRVKSAGVVVRTNDGVVHLSGNVGTAAEHAQVVATAYIAGATRVDSRDLFVAFWVLDPALRRQKFATKSDDDIAQAIHDTLRHDPRVDALALTVHVRSGVATLLGAMSNLRARQAAGQDAANVVGVNAVHNQLQVRPLNFATDGTIRENVQAALTSDSAVGRYSFTLTVSDGRTHLYGNVNSHFDKERAAEVVASISGVVELVNHVGLGAGTEKRQLAKPAAALPANAPVPLSRLAPDHLLEQRIRSHYFWSAQLHDQEIGVSVRGGRATLTGTVDSGADRRQAAAEAHTCGAAEVNNHLELLSLT